jgi:hypothetical protein
MSWIENSGRVLLLMSPRLNSGRAVQSVILRFNASDRRISAHMLNNRVAKLRAADFFRTIH